MDEQRLCALLKDDLTLVQLFHIERTAEVVKLTYNGETRKAVVCEKGTPTGQEHQIGTQVTTRTTEPLMLLPEELTDEQRKFIDEYYETTTHPDTKHEAIVCGYQDPTDRVTMADFWR